MLGDIASDPSTLAIFLAAILGGGGLVPFIWKVWQKYHPTALDEVKSKVEIEAISSHAAVETVEAMKGAMGVLRQRLLDGDAENTKLREDRARDKAEIMQLRSKVAELVDEVRRLGGIVGDLPDPEPA